ncbi:MAG: CAP domain-containing protein [Archangium sp.]|nr:CAP domain-containing protein [Archangium sp.]
MLAVSSCGAPAPEKCDAVTCSSGCCDAVGECRPGFESTACGSAGGVCMPCGAGQFCSLGVCLGGSSGGGSGGGSATGGGGSATGGGGSATGGGSGGGSVTGGGSGGGGGTVTGGGAGGGGGVTGGGTGGGTNDGGVPSCSNITGDRTTQVCLRWTCDRADMSEGTWSGSVATCNPGDLTAAARANSLKLINTYRFIADLPAVTTSATRDSAAQQCALMMDAANALSHTPDAGAPCYTAAGANAAGTSNISSGAAVRSIDLYMSDFGNATTMGHRRWFLSNQLGPVGIGGTPGGSCHTVIGGSGTATKRFVGWPPAGPVPLQAIAIPTVGATNSIDRTGWTLQTYSTADNLTNATVTVTDNGVNMPVTVTPLGANYGSRSAVRWVPMGWVSTAGHSYVVTVTAPMMTTPITYTVDVVSCP